MKIIVDSWAWLQKADVSPAQLEALRKALTITPRKVGDHPGEAPAPLRLYSENSVVLGVPRQFFMSRRKPAHEVEFRTTEGDKSSWPGDLKFNGTLRPEQARGKVEVSGLLKAGHLGGLVRAVPGWGKSPRVGTKVLKYDGAIVKVEDLRVGDLLMGPDSTPRQVLVTNRGFGPLYRIKPTIGDPWDCNDAHILTLVHSVTGEVIDINLQDYLKLSAGQKHHLKQFTPAWGVHFPERSAAPLDPYFVGVWYGDGSKGLRGVAVSKPDAEIELLCREMAERYGLRVRVEQGRTCPTYHIVGDAGNSPNPLLNQLRELFGDGEELPHAYLTASFKERQAFLAGWLDSDGYHNNGCYEVVQKREAWAQGIAFLARSLGIRATVRPKLVNGATYWRVKLAGDFSELPMRIPRKLPRVRAQKKLATRTGFTVERIEDGEYVGIVLDGDHRYLLGDFVVTHNTVFATSLMAELQVPTLVVVHKEFLMDQWVARIQQYLPNAQIGIAQGPVCDFRGKHVVVGMVHSLCEKDYGQEFRNWPGLVITDECFPAGTQIVRADGQPQSIEDFRVGDAILSAAGRDRVCRVMRQDVPIERLRILKLSNGSEVVCTDNHPFLSLEAGWRPAHALAGLRLLTVAGCIDTVRVHGNTQDAAPLSHLWETELRSSRAEVLLPRVYGKVQATDQTIASVRVVWDCQDEAASKSFLHSELSAEVSPAVDAGAGARHLREGHGVAPGEPEHRQGCVETHASAESNAACLHTGEGDFDSSGFGASPAHTRREWSQNAGTPATAAGESPGGLGFGVRHPDGNASTQPREAALALQGGFGVADTSDGSQGRWSEPRGARGTEAGREEDELAAVLRVEGVTVPQFADLQRLGWSVDEDSGLVSVYNLSVENHPSYFLYDSKLLAHNCHRIGAGTWSAVPPMFAAKWRIGLSATPRRKDGADSVFHYHIGDIIFASKEIRMTPKVKRVWISPDIFKLVHTPNFNPSLIKKGLLLRFMCASPGRNRVIVEQLIQAVKAGRKCLVLSERLQHLRDLETVLYKLWGSDSTKPSVGFYIGGQEKEALDEAAKCQVVFATSQLVQEGLDIPPLDTLFLTTPLGDIEQAVGRILRPHEGKKDPIVVDFREDHIPICKKYGEYRDKYYNRTT